MELFKNVQVNFPLCTIAHTPRMPEHCIEYVRVLLWSKENPFGGEGTAIDGDDPQHITWIMEKAQVSAKDDINNKNVILYSKIPLDSIEG